MERKVIMGVTRASAGLALLVGAQVVKAEVALQPQELSVGYFRVLPTLVTQTIYDDNIYSLPSSAVASFIQVLNPSVRVAALDRANVYALNYSLRGAGYANDSNDSYNDHNLGLSAHVEPSGRLKLDGGVSYAMLHDDRGTAGSAGIGLAAILRMGEVDKYDLTTVNGGFQYGADDARGHLVGSLSKSNKRYSRQFVAADRDNDTTNLFLEFNVRLMPKTTALFDYERVDTNYTGFTQDTLDNRYLLGLTWQNTVQSTGRLRFGSSKREVKGGATISKTTWDLGMTWSPLRYDAFDINGQQRASDAVAPYSTTESTSYGVTWRHSWADRLNSFAGITLSKDDYTVAPGQTAAVRSDDTTSLSLGVNYQMRRWLVFNVSVVSNDRNSTLSIFGSKRNIFTLGAQVGL